MPRIHSIEMLLFVALSFVSCHSYRYIGIETYNPATITFPPEIRTVMIVNNAAQQPDCIGHQDYDIFNLIATDSIISLSVDSVAYLFCMALGKTIAEAPLFDDVRLCNDTLRYDSLFYISRPFSANTVVSLCDEYGVDALISLDKLYFKTMLFSKNSDYYNLYYVLVEIIGELRMFYPEAQVAYTIPFTDSLIMKSDNGFFYTMEYETFTVQDVHDAIRVLSELTGQKISANFVPFWTDEKRWYYTSMSSEWRRAAAYALAEKWDAAAKEWLQLYGVASQWKQKARLASNLALCHEIKGDFPKAIEYATTADSLFTKHVDEDNKCRKMQNEYLTLLKKRAEDDKTLSTQLKE